MLRYLLSHDGLVTGSFCILFGVYAVVQAQSFPDKVQFVTPKTYGRLGLALLAIGAILLFL